MLRLNRGQRELLADKVGDVANLAAGALVFGQVLAQTAFSVEVALLGLFVWGILTGWSLFLRRRR